MPATAYLTVEQAAKLLSLHHITIRRMAADGRLPAFKLGRFWRFVEVDLLAFARANYHRADAEGDERNMLCRSTSERIPAIGGHPLPSQAAAQYAALLERKTGNKRRNGTTACAPKCGASTDSAINLRIVGKTP
ncbi:MAG: helix-turn-helix domain-containing protein [Betaproteobacteria bacterium]|nr:helix-turn-helix domain-containing protein [Betaproteobacteria bacterium]